MTEQGQKHRFATYLEESEHRELQVMRAELGLPEKHPNVMQNRQMLGIMRIALRIAMEEVRENKRRDSSNTGTDIALAGWEDVCDLGGVPQSTFERLLREDPRPKPKTGKKRASETNEIETDNTTDGLNDEDKGDD